MAGGGVVLEAVKQPHCLFGPALREAQFCELRQHLDVEAGLGGPRHLLERGRKLSFGPGPLASGEKHGAVVQAAENVDVGRAVAAIELVGSTNPARGAPDLERAGAGHHGLAAGVPDRVRALVLAGERCGHRLVEQRGAFLDLASLDQSRADLAQRTELGVRARSFRDPLGDLERLPAVLQSGMRVVARRRQRSPAQQHPGLHHRRQLELLDQTLKTAEPTPRGGDVAEAGGVLGAQLHRDHRGLQWVRAAAEFCVGSLAVPQRGLGFIQPPERAPEPVQRFGRLLLLERGLERVSRRSPFTRHQGLLTRDQKRCGAVRHIVIVRR